MLSHAPVRLFPHLTTFLAKAFHAIFVWANTPTMGRAKADLMFRAFSDRTRLRILHLLLDGELCVGDLVNILRVPQAKTSRHLAYLRNAGLVVARKNGLWNIYRLAPAKDHFQRDLMKCLQSCFHDVPEIEADTLRAAAIRKSGGCCPP